MKMRAAIFEEPKKSLVLDEVELDAPADRHGLWRSQKPHSRAAVGRVVHGEQDQGR